jgi:hypothetical protein
VARASDNENNPDHVASGRRRSFPVSGSAWLRVLFLAWSPTPVKLPAIELERVAGFYGPEFDMAENSRQVMPFA